MCKIWNTAAEEFALKHNVWSKLNVSEVLSCPAFIRGEICRSASAQHHHQQLAVEQGDWTLGIRGGRLEDVESFVDWDELSPISVHSENDVSFFMQNPLFRESDLPLSLNGSDLYHVFAASFAFEGDSCPSWVGAQPNSPTPIASTQLDSISTLKYPSAQEASITAAWSLYPSQESRKRKRQSLQLEDDTMKLELDGKHPEDISCMRSGYCWSIESFLRRNPMSSVSYRSMILNEPLAQVSHSTDGAMPCSSNSGDISSLQNFLCLQGPYPGWEYDDYQVSVEPVVLPVRHGVVRVTVKAAIVSVACHVAVA